MILQIGAEHQNSSSIIAIVAIDADISHVSTMVAIASITVRDLDGRLKERLRVRAATNGRSMEAEVRSILAEALSTEPSISLDLAEAIRRHIAHLGGIDLEEHPHVPIGKSAFEQ